MTPSNYIQKQMVVFVARVAESGHTLTFRLYADSSSERKVRLLLRMVAFRGTFFNLTVSLGGVHVHSSPGESVGSAGPSVSSFFPAVTSSLPTVQS